MPSWKFEKKIETKEKQNNHRENIKPMSVKDEKVKIYAAFIAYTICIVCTRMTRRREKKTLTNRFLQKVRNTQTKQ